MPVINRDSRRNTVAVNEIVSADSKWNPQNSKKRKTYRDFECGRSSDNIDYILRFTNKTKTNKSKHTNKTTKNAQDFYIYAI